MTQKGTKEGPNEDRTLIKRYNRDTFLIAVADGMGGEPAGDLAAEIAIERLKRFDANSYAVSEDLLKCIKAAHLDIAERVNQNNRLEGMGTTVTAVFNRDGLCTWIHVGDSRLYLVRGRKIEQITEDHSVPGLLLAEGKITKEESRVHPLRSLLFEGVGCGEFTADSGTFGVTKGDMLLLATDGLHSALPEEAIVQILYSTPDLKEKLQALVRAALEAESQDDISVIGAHIQG
ncbi:MAG: serine/threonine-protein phosphatase [Deltaproteobacteria bacterium]|nr:serine/threonine-protein phosphatase [Deltaproteobacteria bacterium]